MTMKYSHDDHMERDSALGSPNPEFFSLWLL